MGGDGMNIEIDNRDKKENLGLASEDFKTNWPKMNNKEKMKWKYQRYMQDYLATISSVDDNVGRVLNYLEERLVALIYYLVDNHQHGFYLIVDQLCLQP